MSRAVCHIEQDCRFRQAQDELFISFFTVCIQITLFTSNYGVEEKIVTTFSSVLLLKLLLFLYYNRFFFVLLIELCAKVMSYFYTFNFPTLQVIRSSFTWIS